MKRVKQIIAFALTAVMMASLFPSSIMADEEETQVFAEVDPVEADSDEIVVIDERPDDIDRETAEKETVAEEDDDAVDLAASYTYTYDRNAVLLDKDRLPGVYTVKAVAGDKKESTKLGMPSIAKQNLESGPTTESPAIIQGAAVPFEKRADIGGEIHFDKLTEDPVCAPYSYFRYELVEEANTGTTPEGASHTKITGFDGTFVILRIDVSDIIKNAPTGSYLHVKQTDNKAMYVLYGQGALTNKADGTLSSVSFSDSKGARVGCYSLDDAAAALKDKDGYYQDTPYVDLVMVSSGTIVAGADKGKTNAPSADFPVTMYVDQTPDYNPEIIWDEATKSILNRDTREPVAGTTDASGKQITPDMMMLDKYYDESKSGGAQVTGYTIKGDDLELEVTVDESEGGNSTPAEYWSLRRAMAYNAYNSHTIKLMCEVPVLQGLLLEGQGRDVILDVNSFDIQLANHTDTNAAGLTVRDGAKLTIADHSNTTGAELAVGNNATMLVETGGKLEIDRTCQLEVEYDAASTAVPAEGEAPVPAEELNYGVIKIVNGGEVINNGVITVEGAEGKAQDATETIIRDYKDAKLTVGEGGTLTNHGCILVNGSLYNLGTIVNDGKYDVDPIISTDPDKGNFTYHRGIQLSWKDDVTQGQTNCGYLAVGIDDDEMKYPNAKLVNSGDIVAIPGYILNRATIENTGNIYLTAVNEVIIPVVASQDQSTVVEKKIQLGYYETSALVNERGATLSNGATGSIRTADFEIKSNGRTGDRTREISSDYAEIDVLNIGNLENAGNISVYSIDNAGVVSNSGTMGGTFGSETAKTAVILLDRMNGIGSFEDSAVAKIQTVYNGAVTTSGGTNKWNYAKLKKLAVTTDEENRKFSITATPVSEGEGISYLIETVLDNDDTVVSTDAVRAGETLTITPDIEGKSGERIYRFNAVGTGISAVAAVDAGDPGVDRPTAMHNLIYDATAQNLVTVGESSKGTLQYSLDNISWTQTIPQATNAGTYKVYYRVVDGNGAAIEGLGGSVDAVIAKRDLYLAADDKGTKKGEGLKELTYTAYGLMDADKDSVKLSSNANKDTAGVYDINISLAPAVAANYNTQDPDGKSRITGGKYFVSARFLNLDIKSNMGGYHNMNQSVVITAAKYKKDETKTTETVANIYYSEKVPLTADNYKSKDASVGATTIAPSYAAVGTNTTVYYYVELPATETTQVMGFAGSQRIVINKGDQLQPGLEGQKVGVDNTVNPPKDIMGVLEAVRAYKGGKGEILGLQCPGKDATTTHPMEYRRSNSDTYILAKDVVAYVPAGTYYVRFVEDDHYNAGPDTEVVVEDGDGYTAVFYNYDNSIFHKTEEGAISYGQKISKPDKDPVRSDGAKFRAWLSDGVDYDFSQPYVGDYEVSNGVVSFYPDWEVSKHTVTFRMNGGGADRTVEVEDGKSVSKPKDPKFTGHTFLGWKIGDAEYDFSAKVTEDITLDATWKINSSVVKYVSNGGRGVMADTPVEYGQTVKLSPVAFSRNGYTFMNWNTASDGSGEAYADGADLRNSEAADGTVINLYAQWRKSLDSSDITVSVAGTEYNGQAQRPAVNVYDKQTGGKKDITGYCSIEYYDNVNAGTAYVIVKPVGSAPYMGEKRQNFTIDKAPVTLQGTSAGREFMAGNKKVDVELSIKSGVIDADKPYVSLAPTQATAVMDNPYAGVDKKAVVDLSNVALTGDKAGNYFIAGADPVSVTITAGTHPDINLGTKRYLSTQEKINDKVELALFLAEDFGKSRYDTENVVCTGIVESALVNEGGTLTYTVAAGAGSGSVTVTLHTTNYGDIKYILNVEKTDIALYDKSGKVCTTKAISEGEKFTLEARFSSTVTDQRVIWESSEPSVASVEDGKVTGISNGTTMIKAFNPATGLYAECMVVIWDQVEEIIVEPSRINIGVGESASVSIALIPLNASRAIMPESSDEKVAVIEDGYAAEDGSTIRIKGVGIGKAKIIVESYDSGKKAVINVTVGAPASGLTVGTKGNVSDVAVGRKLSMTANFAIKPANKDVKWSLSTVDGKNPADIATITEKGVLTGINEGVVRVTATSVSNPSMSDSKDITVYVPVKNVKLNTTSGVISTAAGANGLDLSVTVTPAVTKDSAPGTAATGVSLGTAPSVKYSVDPKFADYLNVDSSSGMVSAKGKAVKNALVYANIKAYGGYDKTLTCKVTVTDKANPFKKVKFTKSSVVLGTGKTMEVDAVMTPLNPDGVISVGLAGNTDPSIVSYEGYTIKDGHILAGIKAAGKMGDTTITLAVTSSAGTANIKCKVKVLPSVSAISFKNADTEKENRLAVGKSLTLKPEFTLSAEGRKAANTDLIWTSSDPGIATVSAKGAVKAVAPGTVTITATSASDDSVKRDVTFKVYAPVKKLKADRKKLVIGSNEATMNCYGKISIPAIYLPDDDTKIEWTAANAGVALAAVSPDTPAGSASYGQPGASVTVAKGDKLAVKGLVPGVTKLTGTATDGSGKKVTVSVTVRGTVTQMILPDNLTVKSGGSVKITPELTINGKTSADKSVYNTYKKYTDLTVSYWSSSADITVDKKGKVSAKKGTPAGTKAVITVRSADGKVSESVNVTVQ